MNLSKIPRYILFALLGISIIIMIMFYFGGYADMAKEIPNNAGLAINWAIILFFIALLVSLAFFVFKVLSDPKGSMKSLFGIVVLGVIFFIAWGLGSGEILNLPEYTGPDNVRSKLKLADMMLYTGLILFILTIVVIALLMVSDFLKRIRGG